MKFLLNCHHCGNRMLYESRTNLIAGKSKRCVYCGKSFVVRNAILQQKTN